MDLDFQVVKYSSIKKADDRIGTHKVFLKNVDGHTLTLSGDESILKGFPLGEQIEVNIREVKTLDDFKNKQ